MCSQDTIASKQEVKVCYFKNENHVNLSCIVFKFNNEEIKIKRYTQTNMYKKLVEYDVTIKSHGRQNIFAIITVYLILASSAQ